MSYIRLSDLEQSGMGQVTSDQVAVEVTRLQQQLQGVQANIATFERQATALRSSQPAVAATFDANVRSLRSAEAALQQQITAKQQLAAQLQQQEAASRQQLLNFASSIGTSAAQVGGAYLQADAQRKAAREESRRAMLEAQNRPLSMGPMLPMSTGDQQQGLSTGAMVAIGVGLVVVVGGGIALAMRQPAPATRNKPKSKCKRCHCRPCTC